jgi:hypothetical protein
VAAPEELFEAREIGDVERRRAACADLVGIDGAGQQFGLRRQAALVGRQ